MIRSLRDRQRRIMPALALLLLAVLGWALLGNRP